MNAATSRPAIRRSRPTRYDVIRCEVGVCTHECDGAVSFEEGGQGKKKVLQLTLVEGLGEIFEGGALVLIHGQRCDVDQVCHEGPSR